MRLQADQRDYKNAFKKHYHAFSNWQATGSNPSKRLILVYCVECGLKYEVMKTLMHRMTYKTIFVPMTCVGY